MRISHGSIILDPGRSIINRGFFVPTLSLDELRDLTELRVVNEQFAGCVNPFMVLNELESGLRHHSLIKSDEQRKNFRELLSVVKPTLMCAAPRIFEKVYNKTVTTALGQVADGQLGARGEGEGLVARGLRGTRSVVHARTINLNRVFRKDVEVEGA